MTENQPEMQGEKRITFRCLDVRQPIGEFYLGAMESGDLVHIAHADIRRLESRDIERYLGIQRPLNQKRVSELAQYVHNIDATFPTSVILAVKSEDAEYSLATGMMSLRRSEKVAKILDGQHRIAGLKGYRGPPFFVNVVLFVDMDIEDQAQVFATINLTQTKVGKSLAYDLFEYAKTRSPQKTAHNVARLLNSEDGSPFKGRIKILGQATPGKDETLTQAAVVDQLLPYLSKNPMRDRDHFRRGKALDPASPEELDALIFRQMFIEERDADIALTVWNYFKAVEKRWPFAWPTKAKGNILNRTTGFIALMRFLRIAYNSAKTPGRVVPTEVFASVLKPIELRDDDLTSESYKPGTSGQSALFRDLVSQSGLGRS